MAGSTSGLKCPVCGEWISTDVPRTPFGRTETAASVVHEKLLVHLQTYHPDYLAWSKPYRIIAAVLFITVAAGLLTAAYLKSLVLLPFTFAIPSAIGIPLLVLYRRKFEAFKRSWTTEHPFGPSTMQTSPLSSMFKCEICGQEITVKKGIRIDRQDHYESAHPDFYRWQQRQMKVIVPITVGLVAFALLFIVIELASTNILFPVLAALFVFLSLTVFYAWSGAKRYRKAWQAKHPIL